MKKILVAFALITLSFIMPSYSGSTEEVIEKKIGPTKFIVEDELRDRLNIFLESKVDSSFSLLLNISISKESIYKELSVKEISSLNNEKYLPGLEIEENESANRLGLISIDKNIILRNIESISVSLSHKKALSEEQKAKLKEVIGKFFTSLKIKTVKISFQENLTKKSWFDDNKTFAFSILLLVIILIGAILVVSSFKKSFLLMSQKLDDSLSRLTKDLSIQVDMPQASTVQADREQNIQVVMEQDNKTNDKLKQSILKNPPLSTFLKKILLSEKDMASFIVIKDILDHEDYINFCGDSLQIIEKQVRDYLQYAVEFSNEYQKTYKRLEDICWYYNQSEETCIQKIIINKVTQKVRRDTLELIKSFDDSEMSLFIAIFESDFVAELITFNPDILSRFKSLDSNFKVDKVKLDKLNEKINSTFSKAEPSGSYHDVSQLLPDDLEKVFNEKSNLGESFFSQLDNDGLNRAEEFLLKLDLESIKKVSLALPTSIVNSLLLKLPEMKSMRVRNSSLKISSDSIRLKKELINYVKEQI
jgi:hypothetical protein